MPTRNRTTGTDLPFIVSVDRTKVDPMTRKLIRSHVMRGKNRVKTGKGQPASMDESVPKSKTTNDLIRAGTIPRWMCSKFSGIHFADEIELSLVEDVFSLLSISSKAMFLLDQCITHNEDGMVHTWFKPLLFDPAYLHVACLTTQAFFDNFLGRTRSAKARREEYASFAKTVKILQERLALDDQREILSDSTLMTVWTLSGYAYTQGDQKAAHQHNVALMNLVKMRGAHETFRTQNAKLVTEIIRTDFCISYENGQKPELFTYEDILWPLILPSNYSTSDEDPESLVNRLEPELAAVWVAMSHFCKLINIAAKNEDARVTEDTFLHVMGSIMYRLLHLRFEQGTLDESIRLGLLAFSAPIFLDWKTVYWINGRFTRAWRQVLLSLLNGRPHLPQDCTWLLMIGTLSMSHDPDFLSCLVAGLRIYTGLSHVATWDDMEELLNSYMWTGSLYNKPGKQVFDSMLAHTGKTVSFTRRYNWTSPDGPNEVLELLDTRPYSRNLRASSVRSDRLHRRHI